MHDRVERLLSFALTLAAIAIAAALVHREFVAGPRAFASDDPRRPPEYVADWWDLLKHSIVVGDSSAPIRIVEFMDLECPFCRTFNSATRELREKHGDQISIAVVHLPLAGHRFARPAARAVECAHEHGRVEPFLNLVYQKQDSLGLKNWASFAAEAGVRDTAAFTRCASQTTPIPRIEAGVALADKFGVNGTPTVLINGWRYSEPPDKAELDRVVAAVLAGKHPYARRM